VAEGGVSNNNLCIGAGIIDTVVVYNKRLATMSSEDQQGLPSSTIDLRRKKGSQPANQRERKKMFS